MPKPLVSVELWAVIEPMFPPEPPKVRQSGANVHGSTMLETIMDAVRPIGRPRKRPYKLHADKGYDYRFCRGLLRRRGVIPRIARKGIESRTRLGRYRWVVERTMAWLNQVRRLFIRFERRADIHQAFLVLGCSLICWNFFQWCVLIGAHSQF